MLRKVVLEHAGQHYAGTIRNVSVSGALVEGLWNVPVGTRFRVALTDSAMLDATARWCVDNRMGLQFDEPLQTDGDGTVVIPANDQPAPGSLGGLSATG